MNEDTFPVLSDKQTNGDQRNKTLKDILRFVEYNNTFADWAIFPMLINEIYSAIKGNE